MPPLNSRRDKCLLVSLVAFLYSVLSINVAVSKPLPYIGDPAKNSLMTNIPLYDAGGNELGKQWFEPKFKTPMDVTTEADPYGYNPYTRQTTEFIDPKSNPARLHIPDFQGSVYTWPIPIVSGPPGKEKHKNFKWAKNAKPKTDLNRVVPPNQSTNTPYPMINQVGKWPQYSGGTKSPDWLRLGSK
jgi:hypothetical protein